MTNTPLMQLVLLHRLFWYKVRGLSDTVPRLGICVINLHPTKQPEIPMDRDGVINRKEDISFSDMTHQQEGMLLLTSDYIHLIRALIKAAEEHGVKVDIINTLLDQKTRFPGELVKVTSYRDIIEGQFQIDENT
jgi:NTE family protein